MATNGSCRLCGADDLVVVQRQTLALLGVGPVTLAFAVCRACALVQQCEGACEAQRQRYRRFSDGARASAPVAPPPTHTARMIAMLRDHLPAARAVYEIEAGAGQALFALREAGFRVGGCDPSRIAAAQAGHVFGIAVAPCDVAMALPQMAGFDALMLSHVLERWAAPLDGLRQIRGAVKRSTGLVLEVPCAVAPEDLPPGWFSLTHLSYFTEATLTRLLARAGFRVLHSRVRRGAMPVVTTVALAHDEEDLAAAPAEVSAALRFARNVAARDAAIWAETARRLDQVRGPVIIWGAGVHTAQLLANAPGSWQDALIGFVDRDSQTWGARLGCSFVQSPKTVIPGPDGPAIVISSFASEAAIAADLAARGVPDSRIVRLYDGREIVKAA